MKVTALAGGVGGAKLLVGLARAVPGQALTAIVNTGDDTEIYGVRVSPDVDIVTYWLAGIADTERGWGLLGDTFAVVDSLAELGAETWFRLGDRDLATCILRTVALRAGRTLSDVTDDIRRAFGVGARILPMSDDPVRTRVLTAEGRDLDFQTYFVRERHEPEVTEVRFDGVSRARPAPGVLDAIETADRVVICPSNPVVSIGPVLALRGVREALRAHPHVTAITPIVRGRALKGPADRLLDSTGAESSASGVARLYADLLERFVVDASDPDEAVRVKELGMDVLVFDTIMDDIAASERLALEVLS